MYFSRLLFPPQPYSVILSVHNGSLLCFPEDSGVHIERVAPLLLFTVACCQNTGYFLLQDQKPISLRQAFNCHPTQQVLKICGFLLNTSCLMGSKIPRQRERQNRLSILWKSLLHHYSKIFSLFANPTASLAFCTFHPYVSDACMFKLLKGRFRKATYCQRSLRIHLI